MKRALVILCVVAIVYSGLVALLAQEPPGGRGGKEKENEIEKIQKEIEKIFMDYLSKKAREAQKKNKINHYISKAEFSETITKKGEEHQIPESQISQRILLVKSDKMRVDILEESEDIGKPVEELKIVSRIYYKPHEYVQVYPATKEAERVNFKEQKVVDHFYLFLRQPFDLSHIQKYFKIELVSIESIAQDSLPELIALLPKEYRHLLPLPPGFEEEKQDKKGIKIKFEIPTATNCHQLKLIPKDKKLAEEYPLIVLWVHWETCHVLKLEVSRETKEIKHDLSIALMSMDIEKKVEDKELLVDLKEYKIKK